MQVPFVGFQPIRTSEHMAAAGKIMLTVTRNEGTHEGTSPRAKSLLVNVLLLLVKILSLTYNSQQSDLRGQVPETNTQRDLSPLLVPCVCQTQCYNCCVATCTVELASIKEG
jgi:hypothetical protein